MDKIYINQIGYQVGNKKLANVISDALDFNVINKETEKIEFSGILSHNVFDEASQDEVKTADFSQLNTNGEYYIKVNNEKSLSFKIDEKPFKSLKIGLLKALYYQRCGVELNSEFAGEYKHSVCHNTIATLIDNQAVKKDVSGGWHDAGDYGRYTVAGATALGHILYAYELFPNAFNDNTGIPESNNNLPDVLNECKIELEWLMKMQANDGGAYNKVATRFFCGMIMPEDDKEELLLFKTSTCATGALTAVMALGARTYLNFDKEFSDRMNESAIKGWNWLIENPDFIPFKNPPKVGSGEYGDGGYLDEIFWASIEMFRLTKDEKFLNRAKEIYKKLDLTRFGWSNVGGFGALSYLIETKFNDDEISFNAKKQFLERADTLSQNIISSGYQTAINPQNYHWGSNMEILNNAIILIVASLINKETSYKNNALEQLNYLMGKNPMGISYVTGFGENAYKFPHHRPSEGDGVEKAIPGLVSGGPDKNRSDHCAKRLIKEGTPPAKCYCDDSESYSTNEVTIYWNSPAIFITAFFDKDL